MDRCAILIDAGHLLAEGGKLCLNTGDRRRIKCDYAAVARGLAEWAREYSGLSLLRTYWYDGAENALPTIDQQAVGRLPDVKLRLGRLVRGEQKGVDALIYRDLMTLARERAISEAFLLAGDYDLREGVVVAQDMGVRVVLLGITSTWTPFNQADALIREVDQHVVLDASFWNPYFSPELPMPSPPSEHGKASQTSTAPVSPLGPSNTEAEAAGRNFAQAWIERATADEVRGLAAQHPIIPYRLDRELLAQAQLTLGSLWEWQDLKHLMRDAFWATIKETAAAL